MRRIARMISFGAAAALWSPSIDCAAGESEMDLTERRKRGLGLTRPELSVVLAYSKI